MNASRLPLNLLIAGICFAANMVSAQLESRATTKFNALTAGPAYGSTNPSPTSQFSGLGVTSSAPNTRTAEEVAAISVGKASLHPVKPVTAATYRNSAGTEVINLQLRRGRMGYSFSSAVPRYYLGDTIQAPSTLSESLSTPVAAGFWRSKPVRPGETFSNPDGSPLIDTAGVALPNIVDNAAVGTPLPALTSGQYESFYYSPHADQVFASQAGSVEICWVSASPQGEGGGAWQFRRENFTVSGASVVPVRKIYWTEKSFDGPRVNIPTGRIELANPIYTANFTPLVSEEYRVPGFVENPEENAQVSSEKRTLWFENFAGNAQLAAFNREGRLMIEYLGPEISPGRLEFLGADVVEVIKSAPTQTVDIELGKRVMPRDGTANLVASPALNIASASQSSFYATLTGGNGDLLYYAEKENLNPDRILFYWMEDLVSSIRLAADANSAGVSILWPIYKDRYRFVWPTDLSEYAFISTDAEGSDTTTGIQFDSSSLPEVIFQDAANQDEASIDNSSQRFIVELDADQYNRSLLKFSSGSQLWYKPIYTQNENRSGYVEPDQGSALTANVTVGERIERPSSSYEIAGAISGGRNYHESAYINPYSSGIEAAAAGAIIPVNARPADRILTVRWFEEVVAPNDDFKSFYVPSKVGRYTVDFPGELGDWKSSGNLVTARSNHSAVLLQNGAVLVAGGRDNNGAALASAERYDLASETWSATGSMNVSRLSGFTLTTLNNGKVLVTGGYLTDGGYTDGGTATAELYDPTSGTWTLIPSMSVVRTSHQATLLSDGRVLVSGGLKWEWSEPNPYASAEIYDPEAGTWTLIQSMGSPRYNHSATLLADGKVMVAGGIVNALTQEAGATVELFDPQTGLWTAAASMSKRQERHSATLLEDGRVLVVGADPVVSYTASAEIYTPSSNTWALATPPNTLHLSHTATRLLNGEVLITGGTTNAPYTSEIFNPETGSWNANQALLSKGSYSTATRLLDGQVITAGGVLSGTALASSELSKKQDIVVMASGQGTTGLVGAQSVGTLYVQNDSSKIGYNPNEEHALKVSNNFYALRDDLNVMDPEDLAYTSEPFLLIAYTDASDNRPAMRAYRVTREDRLNSFSYPWTAGTKLQGPMPLPVLSLPQRNGSVVNTEVAVVPDLAPADDAPVSYDSFTFEDRLGYKWVYRGRHNSGSASFGMQWYYPMDSSFFFPGLASQPAVNTALPFLRPFNSDGVPQGDAVSGTPITVVYTPAWPDTVPSLQVAETLTLSKYGLPDVRNQKSAEVLYQQAVAQGGTSRKSVVLHDSTRIKAFPLKDSGLESVNEADDDKLPKALKTATYQGKTYFQGLSPHLQQRFYYDPLASAKGSLILKGQFNEEIAGDDYLDLNILSTTDIAEIHGLKEYLGDDNKANWEAAVNGLLTRVETLIENPAQKGNFIASTDPLLTHNIGVTELAEMPDADTARDSYALTATGQGQGYVTLMFGNGRNPNLTPASDPPVMKIIKVVPELYNGDLKVLLSSNPLDEKVSLRHSGDFAADTENYEFEWYWAPPSSDGTQPATYTYNNQTYLGNENLVASRQWRFIQTPESARPQSDTFSLGPMTLPASMNVKAANYTAGSNLPGVVFRSNEAVDFSSGIPAQVVFSANVGDLDGFALYVNGNAAVVHQNWINALNNVLNNAYDLRLVRVDTLADLPTQGKRLVIVAEIAEVLHFRIFDAAGVQTVNIDESELTSKATEIANLRSRLNNLWSTTNLLNSDKNTVVASVSTIVGYDQNEEAATGLSVTGLAKQFTVDERFFIKGNNTIEVAVYTNADTGVLSSLDFRLEGATRNDQVLALGSPWSKAVGSPTLDNRATVGGSPSAPLGSPLLVMSDNFFTLRYRAKEKLDNGLDNPAYTMTNGAWTNWTRPALVEGWIKRVLAAINPFNQRMTDLYNNAVNTDVSLLTQAGTRWEGDISLTLDAVNDYGLIEIYETVLKRGKEISIDSGYNYAPANDALLLAAGYLNDLYAILGNEAYADAANPTISIDGLVSGSEVNTSRFSFEGQVASVLDEELALLRGRDDFLSPQVTQSPFYNRLFWNYTRGIDSGEALYATNYNIKEKVGSSTEDGSIDALDAQRMFPQGHGDAYGHYLTALKGYYKLLQHSDFTWTPRTESLNVLGNTVAVDYKDERKFAESAANIARTAEQIVALSLRQQYNDDPANGWTSYRDGKVNSATGNTRRWGLDAWTSRANQGAYYHWAVGNAMLPDVDAVNSGIQKIDRTTVLELQLLPVSATAIQSQLDKANAHLNPLGLSSGAIAFDISPAELKAGKSHYEQVYERALAAVLNAKGAFDQAASMTRLLRNQDNTIDDYNTALQEQERAFNYQLIDLYGKPYPGDLGAGKTYVQGYDGPDLYNWFVVDKASGTPGYVDANYDNLQEIKAYDYQATPAGLDLGEIDIGNFPIDDTLDSSLDSVPLNTYKVYINREGFTQFSEDYWKDQDYGTRPQVGALQQALLDAQDTWIQLDGAVGDYMVKRAKLKNQWTALDEEIDADAAKIDNATSTNLKKIGLKAAMLGLEVSIEGIDESQDTTEEVAAAIAEFFPRVVGLANDVSSAGRGGAKTGAAISSTAMSAIKIGLIGAKGALDIAIDGLEDEVDRQEDILDFRSSKAQLYYEYIENWRDLHNSQYGIGQIAIAHQRNLQAILDLMAQGDRILLEREIFRKRAATTVQGYRTNDLAFRAFRDESLEQYRTLFDLAARYTYLAAKSYDYETGLLGTTAGQAVISRIVSARALGDLTGGQPQATVSSLGDSGLAGTMAQLNADFSVAKGRLGINNPDTNGTLFSLRQELFRLLNDPASSDDDAAWQQTLQQYMVSNLMSDADVAAKCMNIRKADGSAVPGIIIPFTSTIQQGKNFFGLPLAGGDHAFSASNFATKIYSVGVVFPGYVGMDPYAELNSGAGAANTNDPNVLSATPYVYLIPAGTDKMLAPALGDSGLERSWLVEDQALPLPYNLGANDFSDTQFFKADGTLTEQPWITRKHQAFRAVDDPAFFYGLQPAEFSSSRLIGRSAWNTQWKLVIPAYGLLNDEQEGLDRFAATVEDIKLFLRTYSNSGN